HQASSPIPQRALAVIDPTLTRPWPMRPLAAATWEWPRGLRVVAVHFIAKPFNAPPTQRLLCGIHPGRTGFPSRVLLLGPERWDGVLEARLATPALRHVADPTPDPGSGIAVLAPNGCCPPGSLEPLAEEVLPAFLEARGHALQLSAKGAWVLAPCDSGQPGLARVFGVLQALQGWATQGR
ncbi:MAG TPA: hypothetical protein VEI97_08900, partial [bacterium]|nr:hypothetical protein [bacterium]